MTMMIMTEAANKRQILTIFWDKLVALATDENNLYFRNCYAYNSLMTLVFRREKLRVSS